MDIRLHETDSPKLKGLGGVVDGDYDMLFSRGCRSRCSHTWGNQAVPLVAVAVECVFAGEPHVLKSIGRSRPPIEQGVERISASMNDQQTHDPGEQI